MSVTRFPEFGFITCSIVGIKISMRALSTLVRYKEKRSESRISQNMALVPAKALSWQLR
jgi:hypothetical protein